MKLHWSDIGGFMSLNHLYHRFVPEHTFHSSHLVLFSYHKVDSCTLYFGSIPAHHSSKLKESTRKLRKRKKGGTKKGQVQVVVRQGFDFCRELAEGLDGVRDLDENENKTGTAKPATVLGRAVLVSH